MGMVLTSWDVGIGTDVARELMHKGLRVRQGSVLELQEELHT